MDHREGDRGDDGEGDGDDDADDNEAGRASALLLVRELLSSSASPFGASGTSQISSIELGGLSTECASDLSLRPPIDDDELLANMDSIAFVHFSSACCVSKQSSSAASPADSVSLLMFRSRDADAERTVDVCPACHHVSVFEMVRMFSHTRPPVFGGGLMPVRSSSSRSVTIDTLASPDRIIIVPFGSRSSRSDVGLRL